MKRIRIGIIAIIVMVLLAGCGSSSLDITVETAPKYKDGEASPMILHVEEDGEPVQDLDISAVLEMEKMDHGVIEVIFTDVGDGSYSGEVELPMAGEWIADVEAELDDDIYENIVTFEVSEG